MENEAAKPGAGKLVVVTKGRKHKGLIGEITWRGPNAFQHRGPDRVRIETKDGEVFFTSVDQVEVATPEPPNEDEINRIAREAASRRCWAAVTSHMAVIM
jgi:ribosomal protein S4E